MPSQNNNNIIFIKKGHKPSQFLVDLNRLEPEKKNGYKKNWFGFNLFQKSGIPANGGVKNSGPDRLLSGFDDWREKHGKKIERLAFFTIIKLIFKTVYKFLRALYKISYAVGWLAVFFIRFFYLFWHKIFGFVFLPLSLLRSVFKSKEAEKPSDLRAAGRIRAETGKIGTSKPLQTISAKKIEREFITPKTAKIANRKNNRFSFFKTLRSFLSFLFLAGAFIGIFNHIRKPQPENSESRDHDDARYDIAPKRFSFRSIMVFSFVLLALTLPLKAYLEYKKIINLKGDLMGISQAAVGDMIAASKSAGNMDFSQASDDLENASANFIKAKAEIKDINFLLSVLGRIIPGQDAKMAANAGYILDAGRLASDIGQKIMSSLEMIPKGGEGDIGKFFENLYVNIKSAATEAEELKIAVEKINPNGLPEEYRGQFKALQEKSALITGSLGEISDLMDKARIFLGFNYDKRYLLVFQNNAEMRASGGFIGSYAVVDFRDGKITKIDAPGGGSYDTEGGLYKKIIAPAPLHIVNPLWHFWDANWWPDWPATAKKLAWFYEESGGTTVDGVISFTPSVVEKLLAVIGPIDMTEKYGIVFDKDNFWQETQTITEEKYKFLSEATASPTPALASSTAGKSAKTARPQPKNIIRDLFNKIIEELPKRMDKQVGLSLIEMLENTLKEKQTMFYFNNDGLQDKITDLGWDGGMAKTEGDYLMVVNSNIAGGKSDRKISETISHKAEVAPDGSITDTLTIKRQHLAYKNEKFIGVRNVDWLRIYVPEGSELLSARGFNKPDTKYFESIDPAWLEDKDLEPENSAESDFGSGTKIYSEAGKTVFANWCMVDPGETVIIYLKYRLPFKISPRTEENKLSEKIISLFNQNRKDIIPYSLLAQKQPGSAGSAISSELVLPDNFKIVWLYPESLSAAQGGWMINEDLKTDKFWAALVEPLAE